MVNGRWQIVSVSYALPFAICHAPFRPSFFSGLPEAPMSTRREMLQALIASAGAGAVVPGLAAQHPFNHHLADPLTIDQAEAKTKTRAGAYKPEFLDQHQFDTLAALAERIVPGSAKAKVSEFVDQLLAVDAPEDQRSF